MKGCASRTCDPQTAPAWRAGAGGAQHGWVGTELQVLEQHRIPHVLLALHQPTQPALGYLQPQHCPQLAPSAHTAAARAASSVSLLPQQLQEHPAMLGARSRPCWDCKTASASHRIRELFSLEKPSQIIKFNYYPSTAKAITNPCPQVPHPRGF